MSDAQVIENRPNGRDVGLVFIVALAAMLICGLGFFALFHFTAFPLGKFVGHLELYSLTTQGLAFLGAIFIVGVRMRALPWSSMGMGSIPVRWSVACFALGLAFAVAVFTLATRFEGAPFLPLVQLLMQKMFHMASLQWPWFVAYLASTVTIIAVGQELFFRGMLYPWIQRRLGTITAVLLGAGAFVFAHAGILYQVDSFLLGVLLCIVYQKSRSIWPCVALNGGYSAGMALSTRLFLTI